MTGRAFDTIVVGVRVAGAPLATLLARAGQKVLLLDADKLPSDQPMSTHFVQAIGMDWLDELGVGARIRALAPPSHRLRLETRPDIAERVALSVDRIIAPQTAVPVRDVVRWTLGALLRGRFSVIPPFLATGKRNNQIVKLRARAAARLQLQSS
jgi:2-polyprenyl-6-methoxyphenol hydroxylase-like FAD-dependent oxidoreductase